MAQEDFWSNMYSATKKDGRPDTKKVMELYSTRINEIVNEVSLYSKENNVWLPVLDQLEERKDSLGVFYSIKKIDGVVKKEYNNQDICVKALKVSQKLMECFGAIQYVESEAKKAYKSNQASE